jgi:hypothetical protein
MLPVTVWRKLYVSIQISFMSIMFEWFTLLITFPIQQILLEVDRNKQKPLSLYEINSFINLNKRTNKNQ